MFGASVFVLIVRDLRCPAVVSRGIREPSGVEGGAQQPHPAVREIPVQLQKPARTCTYYLGHFCGLACLKRVGLDWASRDVGQG